MATTYEPIATQTLGSAAAGVTFSSIPQTYTDLVIIGNCGISNAGVTLSLRFNGDTGSNYFEHTMFGNGTTVGGSKALSITSAYCNDTVAFDSSLDGNITININNYSNTTSYKSVLGRVNRGVNNGNYPGTSIWSNSWSSNSAITNILIFPTDGSNIVSGSTFTLYGIKAA